jgi:hypothetical protein
MSQGKEKITEEKMASMLATWQDSTGGSSHERFVSQKTAAQLEPAAATTQFP